MGTWILRLSLPTLMVVLAWSSEVGASPNPAYPNGIFSDTSTGEPDALAQTHHVVSVGESLQDIATLHGTTAEQLVWWNGLRDAARIGPGDRLYVGGSSAVASVARDTTVLQTLHRVQTGDTLSEIAAFYGVELEVIVQDNGLADPNRLLLGQELVISSPKRVAPISLPSTIADDAERRALIPHFIAAADEYEIDAAWLMSVAYVESGWYDEAESPTGAIGIGQLMPETAVFISTRLIGGRFLDPWYAPDNIRMSARYLSYLLTQTEGDENTTLAAYYEGLGKIQKFGISNDALRYATGVQGWRDHFATVVPQ